MREDRYLPLPYHTTDFFLMYLIEEIQLLREELIKLQKQPEEAPAPKTRRKKDVEGV